MDSGTVLVFAVGFVFATQGTYNIIFL
jgi:hypothetical protein